MHDNYYIPILLTKGGLTHIPIVHCPLKFSVGTQGPKRHSSC